MLSGWFQTQKLWSACTPRTWISRSTRNRILPIQKGGKLPGTNQCLFLWVSKLPGGATLSANQYFGQCVMPAILGSNAIFTSRWLKQDSPLNTGHYSAGGWASLRARHCEIQKTEKKISTQNPLKTCHRLWMQTIFKLVPPNWYTVHFLGYLPLKLTLLADGMVNSVPLFICAPTWNRSSRRHAKAQAVYSGMYLPQEPSFTGFPTGHSLPRAWNHREEVCFLKINISLGCKGSLGLFTAAGVCCGEYSLQGGEEVSEGIRLSGTTDLPQRAF